MKAVAPLAVTAITASAVPGARLPIRRSISLQNLFGEKAVFLLSKRDNR